MSKSSNGGGGCLRVILGLLFIWALVFGVSVGGKHYGLKNCSCDKGVEIDR